MALGTYTRRFNNRHGRSGHLFQGRFKSILVENDAYVMQLSCYIHRNPLRAGLIERLADYPWSSYPVYAYGKKPPAWLSTGLILNQFNVRNPIGRIGKRCNDTHRRNNDFGRISGTGLF